MSAYGAFYRALFIVLLTPRWISVGTSMTIIGVLGERGNIAMGADRSTESIKIA